ncbi:major facilitator superfamily MFS_1 [Xanthobacter versatilis]|uniref:Major facilitator superfamily MFS_1 n=1 Tax=Xanthobacter autotrophicus (strain ATCC BAA-1158 / Py2) TaxID=78245 RepID=A7IES7_XANP2|nr:major facilitator superfamily MFS_1 [Xanthobacter autotrophicus Py2]
MNRAAAGGAERRPAIPRTVWALGFVSMFMDISSEMIHALLPLFLTATLGASVAMVGLIEGIGESTAAVVKVFSGYLSDRLGRRKPLILLGYGLGAASKPLFALAGAPGLVLAARFADRIGKGMRGAPRDALVADVTPPEIRGRAYGLRQALDTTGAFVGPLLAIALMALLADDMRAVFWFALIPAGLAVACVVLGVEDRASPQEAAEPHPPVRLADLRQLDRAFWGVVAIGVVFTLARFSEAFLVLRAHDEGLPLALAPLVLVTMNAVYALGAYPAGAWSDHAPPQRLLLAGMGVLIAADLLLAFGPGLSGTLLGIALWGVHMALTQGLFAKLVAQNAPAALRGSAFGLFNLATGIAMLAASLVAGLLWEEYGAAATFIAGAALACIAAALVAGLGRAGRTST